MPRLVHRQSICTANLTSFPQTQETIRSGGRENIYDVTHKPTNGNSRRRNSFPLIKDQLKRRESGGSIGGTLPPLPSGSLVSGLGVKEKFPYLAKYMTKQLRTLKCMKESCMEDDEEDKELPDIKRYQDVQLKVDASSDFRKVFRQLKGED